MMLLDNCYHAKTLTEDGWRGYLFSFLDLTSVYIIITTYFIATYATHTSGIVLVRNMVVYISEDALRK